MIEIHLKFSSLSRQQILIATLRIRKVCEASVEIFFARKLPLILKFFGKTPIERFGVQYRRAFLVVTLIMFAARQN